MAVKTIFADTNYFCGLYNPKDTLNKKSKNIFEKIEISGDELIISNYIIAEVLTVLSQRVNKKAALLFWTKINEGTAKIIWIDDKLQEESFQVFKKIKNKNISFVDVSTLALMKKYKINYLLTFDDRLLKLSQAQGIKNLYSSRS